MIALIDYRAGNLTSVKKALAAVGARVFVPEQPAELRSASGIIVPGVGHFGATRALDRAWVETIAERTRQGRPLLGICLGMQWLFETSDEAPDLNGLGMLEGRCFRLGSIASQPPREPPDDVDRKVSRDGDHGVKVNPGVKVPHVGWNTLAIRRDSWIAAGVRDEAQVYFTHSYVAPITADAVAITEHGEPFASIIEHGHIAGVQFHPEKSAEVGLRILRNFVERTCRG